MELSGATSKISKSDSSSSGERSIILLAGVVDLESIERLDREFALASGIIAGQVTLDMSELQLIGEPAIASVLRGIDALRGAGVALEIRYPSPMALQLFEMCSPLQIVGIEFTPDQREYLTDDGLTWMGREAMTGTHRSPELVA